MKSKRNVIVFLFSLTLMLCCVSLSVGFYSQASKGDGYAVKDEISADENLLVTDVREGVSSNSEMYLSSSSSKTGIYLGGGEITSDRKNGAGWNYDFNSNTLTFYGYYSATSLNNTLGITKELFPDVKNQTSRAHLAIDSAKCTSLTIKVKGEYVTHFGDEDDSDDYDKDNYFYYGIYAPGVDLLIDIEDDYAPMKYNPVYFPLQIYTHRDAVYCKNLTITGGGGLRADTCVGSGINCNDLSVQYSRLICYTQHGNNIYHGVVGHTCAAILASGSVTFAGSTVYLFVENTAPKVGSIWAAYQIDVYGIKANALHVKGNSTVNVTMSFSSDVTQNVSFKATGVYASTFTSYDGGKLYTKMQTNDTMPDDAYLCGCYIENYAYFLGGKTTIYGELLQSGSKSFKLEFFMHAFPLPFGSISQNIGDTNYNYTANVNALYLRNDNGALQYASNVLFNDPKTLSSNEIDMADFTDIGSQNVYVVSGDWKIKPISGEYTSGFIALGGSITLELSGGNTYNAFNLYTYTGATIYIGGDGIVNSLNASGCNDVGVERFIGYGTVNFQSGTVKSGWINSGCDVIFYDGNINVDYTDESTSNPYHKWTFDFGDYANLVNFKTDLVFASSTYDRTGLYPIDGKLYSWDWYQTSGTLYRLLKYAVVRSTDGYAYYLYPKAAEAERTFSMSRLTETDVFIQNDKIDGKYYLQDEDTLTLSAGTFGKQVTRPVTTFGGSSSTEILQGTTTTVIPDGFTVSWTRTDKNGNTTSVGSDLSFSTKVNALKDDGSVYTCTIRQGNVKVNELSTSIYVFAYNPNGLAPKLANADETIYFTFSFDDFKGYDDWITKNYNFIWQKDEDGSGNFVDIEGTENQKSLSVTIVSDDSYNALYRVKCYSNNYYEWSALAMKSYPTFYTVTAKPTYRELPYFSGDMSVSPIADNFAGATKYYSVGLQNCYIGVVDVWYEYSTDDGETWQRALNNSAFKAGISIIFSSKYLSPYGNSEISYSWYGSLDVEVALSAEMNGWKLRCVMQSGAYVVYSNEATFTVLDFAEFIVQPEDTVVITSSDSLTLTATFNEDYTDENGNGISNVTYEWRYETWSNGNYDYVKTSDKITTNTLYYENVFGIGSVSRYRLQVKFTYNEKEYTRYSDYAYVYILYSPTFDDGGIVIDNMTDGIYNVGDGVSYRVKDNGVNFHLYKTYLFEVSKDGGNTWQSVGEAFTQSYKNTTLTFSLNNLSLTDGGLYRCKVSIEKDGVSVCSYSDAVNVGVTSALSIAEDPNNYAVTNEGKLTLSAKHEYSSNLSVTYQWQGYDSTLGWVQLSGENYFDVDKQTTYTFGASVPSYEKYRCFVNYKINDDINVNAYTNEITPILIVKPQITTAPVDQTVWVGSAVEFTLIVDNPTENYTILWEISSDGGATWKNAVAVKRGETGVTDYSLLYDAATHGMNGAMLRCTVTNAVNDVFEYVVTEPVTLIVKSGYVKSEQEFLDALNNGMTEFKLLDDIDLTSTVLINRKITLDLNGHVLRYCNEQTSGSVIKITDNATLTLTDGMPNSTHTDDKLPLGGVISGGTGSSHVEGDGIAFGGGISIENGTFIFVGGTIYNCSATYGGGIYASDMANLSLEGGKIDNCSAEEGGGIFSESDIDIKDGAITNCKSSANYDNRSDALYLNNGTLNASGGTVNGTVTLVNSTVVLPEESNDSTKFMQTVYCDNSAIKGGFYFDEVINADLLNSVTVTYTDGEQTITKLIIELGRKALSVSIPHSDEKLLVWLSDNVAYDFNDQVNADLVLSAKWYVEIEVADDLTDDLNQTKNDLEQTKNDLDKLSDKLSSVTAWMIVFIVLFGLSVGAATFFAIVYFRKNKINHGSDND